MPRFSARSLSPLDYGPPSVQNQPEDATTSFSHSALNNQVRQDVPSPSHNNDGRRRYHQDLNDPPLTDSATPRGRQRHSSRGTDDLFETLDRQSKDRQIVFRIHIPSSPSGLIWTGSTDYSGFFAYNRNTAIPPSAYMRVYYLADPSSTDRYGGGGDTGVNSPYESLERNWDMGPYMRHTMVDHIMGKMKQSLVNIPSTLEERPGTPEDDKSCWISTTRSLFWAIWDVARRLALAMEERQRLGDRGAEDRVELAVITQESKIHGGGDDRGKDKQSHPGATEREGNPVDPQAREVWVNPLPAIRHGIAQGRGGRLSVAMKETYEIALRTAEECQEVLYQGRIFAESIKMNLVFSSTKCPITLPPQFLRSRKALSTQYAASRLGSKGQYSSSSYNEPRLPLEGWLGTLSWDPRDDNFARAEQKVVNRRREMMPLRGATALDTFTAGVCVREAQARDQTSRR